MPENNISSKHHTIPQFYLNYLDTKVPNGYWIYRYNKNILKELPDLVSNVGFIKDFNTIEIEGKKTDIYEKMHNIVFEKKFAIQYARIINKIRLYIERELFCYNCLSMEYYNSLELYCINYEDKLVISYLLAYFIYRSRKLRRFEEKIYDKREEIIKDMYRAQGFLDIKEIDKKIKETIGSKEDIKISQLKSLFKGNAINNIAEIIYNHIWVIAYNNTEELIYTSDNGHSMETANNTIRSIGYDTYGNIIIFPLTPKICIIMYDKMMFEDKIGDLSFINLNKQQIKVINNSIVFDGIDEIYSKDGDWTHLKQYYKKSKIPRGHKPYGIH